MLNEMSMSTAGYENSSSDSMESDECAEDPGVEILQADNDETTYASTITSRSHKRVGRTGTVGFIPHDIVKRPKLVALATRLRMTPTQQAAYTKAFIEEAGGDLS